MGKRETLTGKKNQLLISLPSNVNIGTLKVPCCFTTRSSELSTKVSRGQQALLIEAMDENRMGINTCLGQASSCVQITCKQVASKKGGKQHDERMGFTTQTPNKAPTD